MIGNAAGLALAAAGNAAPNRISSSDGNLRGFDRDVISLIFNRMLSLPVTFVSVSNFADLYVALLDGVCDVAITASQMDPTISQCSGPVDLTKATAALFDYTHGDYAEGTLPFGPGGVRSEIRCLQFGQAYISGGFALLSMINAAPIDPVTALFSPEVCNAATASASAFCLHERGFAS